jgi:transcriptional regulator with PAS, ATPase and Fis domain
VRALIERSARTDLPVLVTGESGTGKELAARAVHQLSERATGPFVTENCAAIPASIIEAELFGYRRGAFTGATTDRPGVFQRAHGGTLFLDEIGEMPLELQAKLLRVLETSEVRPLGDSRPMTVDFRLVAATNRDLEREVREGRFRQDLFYRLAVLQVCMPNLSECAEDVPALAEHFLRLEAARTDRRCAFAPAVLARLASREWPGNVRELRSEVARLCALAPPDQRVVEDPSLVSDPPRVARRAGRSAIQPLADLERDAILAAVEHTGGDKRAAAELLGISRAKVYQRLKDWREGE